MSRSVPSVRLQKYLADCGLASRRKAEEIIQSGRVRVNGAVVKELGTKVDPDHDLVVVDGAPVERKEARRYILLYKPPGCVTTLSDPQGRPTARGYLTGVAERVFPVGRLDYDAEGALLFTDDGELANRLAHPSYGHKRVYLVKTKGDPGEPALRRLVEGVRLEDGPARALVAEVHEKVEKNTWVKIVVGEGRNHLVKRLCEAVGLPVLRLYRPEFGGITVERLRPGHWRDLTAEELVMVRRSASAEKGEEGRNPMSQELPKAGRRHGHGPPPQGTAEKDQPADRMREARRAEAAGERPEQEKGRARRDRRPQRTDRPERSERPGARPTAGGRPEKRSDERRGGKPDERREARPDGRRGRPDSRRTGNPDNRRSGSPDGRGGGAGPGSRGGRGGGARRPR